ncbi:hypothetical protein [Amycolatopsis sp. NPDC004378]
MKPTADIKVTGEVTQMNVEADGSEGDIVAVADVTTEDGKTARMLLRINADGARYLRERIEDATPTPAAIVQGMGPDSRVFRTELIWTETDNAAWNEKAGWSLYVDAELVAHTGEKLTHEDAQAWANKQLAEGMTWLQGHETETFYWVASPSTRRA